MNRWLFNKSVVMAKAVLLMLSLLSAYVVQAQHAGHEQHSAMSLDTKGMTMNHNPDELPIGCAKINREYEFTVSAGVDFASEFPGTTFGYSQREFEVEPCSLVTITLDNKDQVRHQWMLHGLPRYLYPQGMFSLEAAGGETRTASFIVPSDKQTYLVHCDITQHMEKGMKAQLKVGGGSGDLWSIAGVSGGFKQPPINNLLAWLLIITMAITSFLCVVYWRGQD
ncbi:MAG: copper oxidase [SAR86 cluster bacterium]|uniref:Copper oxidase n=1 Tax=SAR86 cluster bacterium TaxID=2030880 RepID=A0A2A4MMT2_9GAMM|nr:MAG: copper oxidase [SAR86 cluster bacterium]